MATTRERNGIQSKFPVLEGLSLRYGPEIEIINRSRNEHKVKCEIGVGRGGLLDFTASSRAA